MPTISGGIHLALSAILAHSHAMEITEHNVANANTPGYRRQSVVYSASTATASMFMEGGPLAGQRGTGVSIDRIDRFNLQFFDGRYRAVSADAYQSVAQRDVLKQLEATLAETSENGLIPTMDQFWSSWSNLAADPTNLALRAQVLDYGKDVADAFNRRSTQIRQLQSDQDLAIKDSADQINQMATEIANLNAEISHVLSVGDQPNDLLDKRDLLLDQLAQLSGAVSSEQANGEVMVSINGHALVVGHDTFKVKTVQEAPNNFSSIRWEIDDVQLNPPSGTLKGLFTARDTVAENQLTGLNTLVSSLISEVNTVHTSGYDMNGAAGLPFFTGTTAGSISVNSALQPANLAAASVAGEPGNSLNASKLADLKLAKPAALGATMGEYYNAQVTSLGITLQSATQNATHQNLVAKALSDQRESVAGVNLNEEAANMLKYQRAFQAASRVLNAYDEMLDRIINGMGLGGR